ncbi:MAG: hypothetical protein MZV70_05145 [Desulfobacterales bacterium]|nr:hypothetical protein [Desulfobacterales bacterium]
MDLEALVDGYLEQAQNPEIAFPDQPCRGDRTCPNCCGWPPRKCSAGWRRCIPATASP